MPDPNNSAAPWVCRCVARNVLAPECQDGHCRAISSTEPRPDTAGRTSIVACRHSMNGRQIPCPSRCPRQDWPRSMFRLDWRGRYVLRRRYRKADHAD